MGIDFGSWEGGGVLGVPSELTGRRVWYVRFSVGCQAAIALDGVGLEVDAAAKDTDIEKSECGENRGQDRWSHYNALLMIRIHGIFHSLAAGSQV